MPQNDIQWLFFLFFAIGALGGWLIFTQSRLLGIIIALLGIIYLVNEIYENSKGNEVAE